MKNILIVLFIFLISCENSKQKDKSESSETNSFRKNQYGIIEFNFRLISEGESFEILNHDKSVFAGFQLNTMKIKNKSYNLDSLSDDSLQTILGINWFYPEYHILIAECVASDNNYYEIVVGNTTKYVKKDNQFTVYETYENFLKNSSFNLNDYCPLRIEPNDSAAIINEYKEYTSYQIVEFKEDWIKVKPDKDLFGETTFEGWVRWWKNEKLLIKDIYFSY